MVNKNNEVDYQNLFHLCFEYSDNLFLILSDDLAIQNINPAAEKLLGWKKEEVCTKKIISVFQEKSMQPFVTINPLKTNKNITHVFYDNQKVKIVWNIISAPYTEKKDNLIFIIGKSEPEISKEQFEILQLENVVKYAPGLFYWKDMNSVYQGCNDEFARLAGLESSAQVIGKTDFDLIWKERAELYVNVDKEVLESGVAKLNHVEDITISSKKTINAITNKVPLQDNNGQIIGILGITTDITRQKEIEHALSIAKELAEVANHAKTEFIANMSHDIRTPLSGVVGMSKVMEDRANDPEEKQYAHWVNESGEQLLSLLNGILDVVSAGNINDSDLREEPFDLRRCIQDIAQLELPTIKLKNLDLNIDISEDVPQYLVSDRTKLHRILLNLLGNSIKFTQKGHVAIGIQLIERHDDAVCLRFNISDTGIGIPQELQAKVFERFFRVNPSYKSISKGHGIGLNIAQSYVELLGGELKLTSQVGEGTTFYFDLVLKISSGEESYSNKNNKIPLEVKEPEPPVLFSEQTTVPVQENAPHLLLIEDNHIALRTIEMLAKKAGCRYTSAEDAELGFKLIQSTPFDLIITDIGLPGMSGVELAQVIRTWEQASNRKPVPIVGLTAHTGEDVAQKCLQSGINKVLSKPATLKIIQEVIKELIREQPACVIPNALESTSIQSGLGPDLPKTEEELFQLDQFPILDVAQAVSVLGNEEVLKEILTVMLNDEGIEMDKLAMIQAHTQQDWDKIEGLAHKMKSGAAYCGTIRLHKACQYLERYRKAGHYKALEPLYNQFLMVLEETRVAVAHWLLTEI